MIGYVKVRKFLRHAYGEHRHRGTVKREVRHVQYYGPMHSGDCSSDRIGGRWVYTARIANETWVLVRHGSTNVFGVVLPARVDLSRVNFEL